MDVKEKSGEPTAAADEKAFGRGEGVIYFYTGGYCSVVIFPFCKVLKCPVSRPSVLPASKQYLSSMCRQGVEGE